MEIQQLKGFRAIARYGSFSAAARKTFRTQPAISLQLRTLEDELGTKLIERSGRKGAQPTEDGQILLKIITPILEQIDEIPVDFATARGAPASGTVTLATHSSVVVYLLPNIVRAFYRKHSKVKLSIISRSRDEIVEMVQDGSADLGITSLEVVPRNLECKELARYRRILIASKSHPLANRERLQLDDIAEHPLILAPRGSLTRKVVERAFRLKDLHIQLAMELTDRDAVKSYVRDGLGISIVNEYYLRESDQKRFYTKDVTYHFGYAKRAIINRKGKSLSTASKALFEMITGSVDFR